MPLSSGTRLGPYEIVAAIGSGGMGEVYRALDTRLDRVVAIKILPEHISGKPQARERFEREARAVSSLNHPHICTLHDIGHQDGIDYLVMEYLEGETLAYRLKKGPLPTEQLLQYAIQITDALDTAHRHGVIHRDLKPGNIMLTKAGAKLLDFGLAKVRAAGAVAGTTALPTETSPLTSAGAILGTLQYMAPEQLEGKEADARTDIFALGAVIYEMATSRKAFEGKSQASLISAIMSSGPPPISGLQVMAPPILDHAVRTCLAKNPEARWQSAHDVLVTLQWIADDSTRTRVPPGPRRPRWLPAASVATFLVLLAVAALVRNRFGERQPVLRRLTLTLLDGYQDPAISPDGQDIVFVRNDRLWVQDLARDDARELPGTEGGFSPFWSPDSRTIGFGADAYLRTAPVNAGPVTTLCKLPGGWQADVSGTWSPDGQIIVFSAGLPALLYQVPATGGEPQALEYPRPPGRRRSGRAAFRYDGTGREHRKRRDPRDPELASGTWPPIKGGNDRSAPSRSVEALLTPPSPSKGSTTTTGHRSVATIAGLGLSQNTIVKWHCKSQLGERDSHAFLKSPASNVVSVCEITPDSRG